MSGPKPLRADYTQGAPARALLGMLYRLALFAFRIAMRGRIDRVVGLEHLPRQGPFVIVANHLSYMDDFLVAYAVRRWCGEKLYIPTNTKAFRGVLKSWLHLAGGAVEIDPADRVQSYDAVRRLLADGKIVLMFPEGTRSDGSALLPFKFGAFNLARDLRVTTVPVALVDTHRVLPKHRLRPVAGARASAAFLAPLAPALIADPAAAKEACRDLIADALFGAREWSTEGAARATAHHVAARAEAALESLIERGPETIRAPDLAPVFDWIEIGRHSVPTSYEIEVQAFRAWGFRLLCAAKPLVPLVLVRFHTLAANALQRDPRQPFVHYVRGQFHLRAPWIAGGRRRVALAEFDRAYRWASHYGIERQRFTISYAEALARNGRVARAQRLLERDFVPPPANLQGGSNTPAPIGTERIRRRTARAAALLERLRAIPD
jgi:1-acyl-sn-glycerol-3-phosphate acyltransferase